MSRLRAWPLLVVAGLSVLVLIFIWAPDTLHRQNQVMQSMLVLVVGLLLSAIWLLTLSRLPWKLRWRILAIGLLIFLVPALPLRIGGSSGALVPLLEWRWSDADDSTQASADPAGSFLLPAHLDYPRFLGPKGNAIVQGIHLRPDWKLHPPQLLWRRPVGAGWSAFAISGRLAITQEQHGAFETVVARDLLTGNQRWTHRDSARYESSLAGVGPRATPTIDGDRLFTMGGTGLLNALNLATGDLLWQRNVIAENGASVPDWGVSCSPLVLDSLVIVSAGGPENASLVAYHRDTGARVWSGGSAPSGYSSPFLATLAGVDQILVFNTGSVAAHRPDTGALLWDHPWSWETQPVAQPMPLPGDRLLVSSGYGIGSRLFQLSANEGEISADARWESTRLKAKFTNPVYHDGFVYGLDDGVLVCLDPDDGERRWKKGRYGHGQIMLVENLLLIQAESGELALVEARPDEHRELSRYPALHDKTWNNPALAGPYLLVRNHKEAACFRLAIIEDKLTMDFRW